MPIDHVALHLAEVALFRPAGLRPSISRRKFNHLLDECADSGDVPPEVLAVLRSDSDTDQQ